MVVVYAGGPKTKRLISDAYFRQRIQNRACNTHFSNHVHGVGWGINVLSAKNFQVRY